MGEKYENVERIFKKDSREKKRIAIAVHNRASRLGYIRGGIKMPSDFLTNKQIRELSGEVKSYNMYENYKNLANCNLDEILSKDKKEIKAILTIIKKSNNVKDIGTRFNVSQGKLYKLFATYGVEFNKKPRGDKLQKEIKDNGDVISLEKFNLMDSIEKGRYLINIQEKYPIAALSRYWNTNKSGLFYFIKKVRDLDKKNEKFRASIKKADNIDKKKKVEENSMANNLLDEPIKNNTTDQELAQLKLDNELLLKKLEYLQNEIKQQKDSRLVLNINGIYNKQQLSDRLVSLDYVTLPNKAYKLNIEIIEIDVPGDEQALGNRNLGGVEPISVAGNEIKISKSNNDNLIDGAY